MQANQFENKKAMFDISYGLYVITSNDTAKDNGFICNSVMQLTSEPNVMIVSINKNNYSHDIIKNTKKMNVNILTTKTPFDIFKHFGFQSGKTVNKFENGKYNKTSNNLIYLDNYINSVISLNVFEYKDMVTHGMFLCNVSEMLKFNEDESITYDFYQKNVKPKREDKKTKGFVCTVCGYVYEGDVLPDDFICPICKHGKDVFEKIK